MLKTKAKNTDKKHKQPVQRRSQQRVAKIMAAAEIILRDQGALAVTFHAVAKEADIPPSSVYQYFPTKDLLLLKEGKVVSPDEICQMVKEKLGSIKTPKTVEFWSALPRSGVGKVLKKEIRKHFWSDQQRQI